MAAPSVTPRPGAAVALAREVGDSMAVFMVRRHGQSPFMPDVFVFPGGAVEEADLVAEALPGMCAPIGDAAPALGSGFRLAAIRECFEEAGVLLAYRADVPLALKPEDISRYGAYRAALHEGGGDLAAVAVREGLTLATDALLHWAHWITPEGLPRRFDVHFFLAEMLEGQEAAHDRLETTEGVWITPEDALQGQEAGNFPLAFPTINQLQALTGLTSVAAAFERFAGRPVRSITSILGPAGERIPQGLDDPS